VTPSARGLSRNQGPAVDSRSVRRGGTIKLSDCPNRQFYDDGSRLGPGIPMRLTRHRTLHIT
jgi:hypothetical protein